MENNPLYRQGLEHMGRSEWGQAIDCFTRLQTEYPTDPRIRQILETARLRADMGARPPARAARLISPRVVRLLSVLGLLVVLLVIAIGLTVAYRQWALPVQAAN